MGWTRRNVAANLLLDLDVQRREAGRRVAALMEAKGWTHEDLAHEAKVSVKTVSRVVNGKHESRNNTIERIANALGKEKDEIWPKAAPLALGVEDPYQAQLDRIEQGQTLILKLLVEHVALDLEPELDAEIQRVLRGEQPPSAADDESSAAGS